MAQVRGFWHQLETATNERQRALLRRLNGHLEGLSRAIEVLLRSLTSIARPRTASTRPLSVGLAAAVPRVPRQQQRQRQWQLN